MIGSNAFRKLTPEVKARIRDAKAKNPDEKWVVIAARFGVSPATARRAVLGPKRDGR